MTAPSPRVGEVVSTPIPDTFQGIRFEVGRMVEHVRNARRDAMVLDVARYIAERTAVAANAMGVDINSMTESEKKLLFLEGIVYWCQESFFFVSDPTGIEVMETPARQLRRYRTPAEILEIFWGPILKRMGKARGIDTSSIEMPEGRAVGDCEEGVCLSLGLATALDIAPVRFEFGGAKGTGTLHHVWSGVYVGDELHQFDVTQPQLGLGEVLPFEHYDFLEFEV